MGKFKTGCLGVIGIAVVIGLVGSCAGGGTKDQNKAATSTTSSSHLGLRRQNRKFMPMRISMS